MLVWYLKKTHTFSCASLWRYSPLYLWGKKTIYCHFSVWLIKLLLLYWLHKDIFTAFSSEANNKINVVIAGSHLSPLRNVDSNSGSLCKWKGNKNQGRNLAGERCSDLAWNLATWAGTIRHCGVWTERDLWQMRVGERGAPSKKNSAQSTIHRPGPSATCGAREELWQRPPTGPIGCKISSRPSWIQLRKWEIPKRKRDGE